MSKFSRRDFIVKAPAVLAATAVSPELLHASRHFATTDSESSTGKQSESVEPLPFTKQDLFSQSVRDSYSDDYLNQVAFPMGGIGSGCISMAGTGRLIDWEIFNNPNRGFQPRFTFLSVWAQQQGSKPAFKVLEGQLHESFEGPMYLAPGMDMLGNGEGPQQTQAAGLPRMRKCKFTGRFPFAQVELSDRSLPLVVKIEGWSPFIPGNSRDSSLPIAVLNVTLKNTTNKPVRASVAINMQNCAGERNQMIREHGLSLLHMHGEENDEKSMFIATPMAVAQWQANWQAETAFLSLQHFVDTFAKYGKLDNSPATPGGNVKVTHDSAKVGSLAIDMELQAGESKTVPLIIGWYFPIFDTANKNEMVPGATPWRNYYATEWKSGLDVARYAVANLKRLEADTRLFQMSLFSSTIPGVLLEAASTQMSILRSPTVIRYPDGTLYGWEGCAINHRLGHGTVNHVWNYQQTIPYLFPDLQRSILNNFFFNGLRESDGAIQFRMPVGPNAKAADMPEVFQFPFGGPNPDSQGKTNFFTAADGQFGLITQAYRDWHITGDTAWFEKIWPRVKKGMEYAWTSWDPKREGLLTGSHHCTLDLNFTTPETMCGSQYQAALLACEQMAMAMDDTGFAKECRRIYESGKRLSNEKLYNGKYYQQLVPAPGVYQLDTGCISEVVNGQLYARMLDLEDVYEPAHIHSSLAALFHSNYRDSFDDVINVDRVFSLNDDRGLQIVTWPKGGRPAKPLLYCDETWPGAEYQAAFNMIYDGYVEEGLTLVKSIRDRYDGKKRNPFCEFEWGNHYARSMIAYAGILAISQFRYSAVDKSLQLAPLVNPENFRTFFSVGSGWGVISQTRTQNRQELTVTVSKGNLTIRRFHLESVQRPRKAIATLGGYQLPGKISADMHTPRSNKMWHTVEFTQDIKAEQDKPLHLMLDLSNEG
jgi:non-lysosomal glucosylceramidase